MLLAQVAQSGVQPNSFRTDLTVGFGIRSMHSLIFRVQTMRHEQTIIHLFKHHFIKSQALGKSVNGITILCNLLQSISDPYKNQSITIDDSFS